jgi:cysteine synthase
MSELVGKTPAIRIHCPELSDVEIYCKLEGYNPTGSIKDRTCVRLLQEALQGGTLRPGVILLDASSGNLGCALAYYCRLAGYKSFVVSSSKLTGAKRDFIQFYGAEIHLVGNFTIEGNQYCRELVKEQPGKFCFLDQLHNWINPKAHYESTGPEILADFPDLAMVVGSLGSGGSLLGIGQYIKERSPDTRVVAVQAASGTRLPGTASLDEGDYVTPFIAKGFNDKIFGSTVKVTEADAVSGVIRLRDQGIFCGLQTGGVFSAAIQAARDYGVKGRVVIISGDSGWKNMDKLLTIRKSD